MKSFKKITAIIIAISIVIGLLSGCTATVEGKALYDAFVKTQTLKASQNIMELSMKLDVSGLSETDPESFAMVKAMLSNAKIKINTKQVVNENKTASKKTIDGNISTGGASMDIGVWIEKDYTGTEPRLKEVIKLPAMLTSTNPKMANKDYLVMDLEDTRKPPESDVLARDVNFPEMMKLMTELKEKANEFLVNYLPKYDPGFKFITDAGTKDITSPEGTVKTHVYQIKLDDKSAKELIRYTVNNFADNKDAMDFLGEYIKFIQKFADSAAGTASSTAELEKMMSEFATAKPELLAQFNSFMDQIAGVQLIGNKGIVLEYAIDDNGFIVNQSANMDLVIDMAKLNSLENGSTKATGVYSASIDFSMFSYNLNKDMNIEMPQLTPENSVDYMEMMKTMMQSTAAQNLKAVPAASKVLVDGKSVSFELYTIGGSNYIMLRDLAKAVNGTPKQFDVTWDNNTETINLISNKAYTAVGGEMTKGDGKEKIPVLSTSIVMKDGVQIPLEAYKINENTYFRLRDLGQAFNIGITWDNVTKTIGIDTKKDYTS